MSIARTLTLTIATTGFIFGAVGFASNFFPEPHFSTEEIGRIKAFWSKNDRLKIGTPPELISTPWQPRLTVKGSRWLYAYNNKRGVGKTGTVQDGFDIPGDAALWEAWISKRWAFDCWQAVADAREQNLRLAGPQPSIGEPPEDPGTEPESLQMLIGEAPTLVAAAKIQQYTVKFDDLILTYNDHVPLKGRNAFYRFDEGVISSGLPVNQLDSAELNSIFKKAGVSASDTRVMMAVSPLEGGFDSVNTYDIGLVSAGFIQFACLNAGAGSLGRVLLSEKGTNFEEFQIDFRKYGIDVDDSGDLVALDLESGDEKIGPAAARQIILDKRLIAVFQRAGQLSEAYKVAQIRVAKEMYLPSESRFDIAFGDRTESVSMLDIYSSEAGRATLMDRKVHTGNLSNIPGLVQQYVDEKGIKSVDALCACESDLIVLAKHRRSFLNTELSQPKGVSPRRDSSRASRHKGGRGGG